MSNESNNAPAVPQGWTDADSDSARLALELECLLMDTKDLSVVSKWWASANEALELHRQRLAATPATAPAQEVGLTDEQADAVSMALRRAWQLGQTYWQQADSDYISQHKKSEETQRKFEKLCDSVIAAIRAKGGK